MFGLVLLILGMVSSKEARSVKTSDLCSTVQFDFTHPLSALAAYKTCVDVDNSKLTQLHQRFLASWAKFSVDAGVGQALLALENPEVRDVLLSDEEWNALHWTIGRRPSDKIHDLNKSTFVAEMSLVVALTILTSIAAVWTLKLKSAVLQGLPKRPYKSAPKGDSAQCESEREMLLHNCGNN